MSPCKPFPHDQANYLSKTFLVWLLPLFRRGLKEKALNLSNVYLASIDDESNEQKGKLEREWRKELKKPKPSLASAIYRAYMRKYLVVTMIFGGYEELVIKMIQPLFLGALLDFFAGTDHTEGTEVYLYAFGFALCSSAWILFHHPKMIYMLRAGMRVRIACQGLLMEKALRLSKSSVHNNKIGNIINLMSNDVNRFEEAAWCIQIIPLAPIQAIIISIILSNMLGYSYLIGLALLVAFVPLQSSIGKIFGKIRQTTAKWTDKRIRTMSEIINGIKVIKLYTWEKSFVDRISGVRRKEISKIRKSFILRAFNTTLSFITARIILFVVFMAYVYAGHPLTAKVVFVSSAYYNLLGAMLTGFFPTALSNLYQALTSCKRITQFLLLQEKDSLDLTIQSDLKLSPLEPVAENGKGPFVHVDCLKASWDIESEKDVLEGISMKVQSGQISMVTGPVGSGKSFFLLTLMKETVVKSGSLEVNGTYSYCSQEPWTWNSSIRDNIIFFQPLDEERYRQVLEVTTLDRDIELLPHGDRTLVGERGTGLSGGQRARVNLARAIYRQADIYLLDDPLSAVDAKCASTIFQKCCRQFLGEKVVILVTHQIQFLSQMDSALVTQDGGSKFYSNISEMSEAQIWSEIGSVVVKDSKDLRLKEGSALLQREETFGSNGSIDSIEETVKKTVYKEPTLSEETQKTGNVSGGVYWAYLRSGSTFPMLFLFIVFNLSSQILYNATDVWLSIWTNDAQSFSSSTRTNGTNSPTDNISTYTKIVDSNNQTSPMVPRTTSIDYNSMVYCILIIGMAFTTLIRAFSFFHMANRASINLHDSIFYRILRSPMSLFESQPIGRILNRFSRDLSTVDEDIPTYGYSFLQRVFQILGMITLTAYVSWYLIFPALVLILVTFACRKFYLPLQHSLKRQDAITRSPFYSHISTTIDGLETIRAFGVNSLFQEKFQDLLNENTTICCLGICAKRWLCQCIDWFCAVFVAITTLVLVVSSQYIQSGDAGMALSNVVALIGIMHLFTFQSTEFETRMTAVERILEYSEMPTEAELESSDKMPPPEWPEKGSIKFNELSLQYSSAPEPSLKNISLEIRAGEKVGVVGRTGAGKSSLLSCLFRIVEFTGSIEIDGISIQEMGLHDLRKKISIIPQEPVLFATTVRKNLDPFNEHSDEKVWQVLEDVRLKGTVLGLNGELDHEVTENGSNFSIGQRQLICLGRALLRENKILVIDEATANVDHKTDSRVQEMIRSKFSNCTVLTIAHRLNTIIESDRVLVLAKGEVAEFDCPSTLLRDENSLFSQLISRTGASMRLELIQRAESSYRRRIERQIEQRLNN